MAISANLVHHGKTKHVEMDCHFFRDKAQEGFIQATYIPSSKQVANIFTKQLHVAQDKLLLTKLGVSSPLST